jgi:phage head maturation protease
MTDRPKPGAVEDRSASEAGAPVVEGRKLRGLIPYGVESSDLGGWTEVIDPGALDGADLGDLIATREHDRSKLLGRHPTTLTTEDRDDGFSWAADLPNSPVGEDVRVAVERGDLRATSWRMVVAPGGDRGTSACLSSAAATFNGSSTSSPRPSPAPPSATSSTRSACSTAVPARTRR